MEKQVLMSEGSNEKWEFFGTKVKEEKVSKRQEDAVLSFVCNVKLKVIFLEQTNISLFLMKLNTMTTRLEMRCLLEWRYCSDVQEFK